MHIIGCNLCDMLQHAVTCCPVACRAVLCRYLYLCRAAQLIRASHDLQLNSGLLLAVPIPAAAAAEGASIQAAIQESLQEAEARGIAGAEVRAGWALGYCGGGGEQA